MGADPAGGGHHAGFGYHAALVGDPIRLVAYERALRALIRPGARVLDVGTGTGILAALAAHAGAGSVTAVESTAMADVARDLIADNGLADRVEVIRADMRALPVPQVERAVDVIVSDCLGRFVIDDFMTEAMASALHWLRPGGAVIPSAVRLFVAPVAAGHIDAVDLWARPALGVSLGAVGAHATHRPIGVALDADRLLGPARLIGAWTPGELSLPLSREPLLVQTVAAGRWVGFAGWFEADLAPGVVLSTAPGIGTHWQQLLFPVAPRAVDTGTTLTFSLEAVGIDVEPLWRWEVTRSGGSAESYGHGRAPTSASSHPRRAVSRERVEVARERGATLAAEGRFAEAAAALSGALSDACALQPPLSDEERLALAADAGAALLLAGHPREAFPLLLLAAESGPELSAGLPRDSAEQAARLVVDAAFGAGRTGDGRRLLAAYESRFGPHPAGWRPQPAPPSPHG